MITKVMIQAEKKIKEVEVEKKDQNEYDYLIMYYV
jgi:hypothetical protein